MLQEFMAVNALDANGNPAGGSVESIGLKIDWQNGPLSVDGERKEPNGAFVETVIAAAKQRIEFYQSGQFACEENQQAINKLESALASLDRRTKRRVAAGTEGTHKGS